MRTTNKQVIQEVPWGMLVWQLDTGEFAADDDGNFMHVFCTNQDPKIFAAAEKALREAAKFYGAGAGRPVFWAGKRPINDEELQHQLDRAKMGLVPDPLDIAAIREEERMLHQRNG